MLSLRTTNYTYQLPWDFGNTQEVLPHKSTPYTEQEIANRLALPDIFTGRSVFDTPASNAGIRDQYGIQVSTWGRQLPVLPEGTHTGARTVVRPGSLYLPTPIRKAYEGGIYMQGEDPTCGAWATVHALLAADVQPSVSFVTDVMNSELGLKAGERRGITTFKTAQLLEQHYPHDIAVDIPAVRSNGLSVRQVISYVKEAVDKGGAIKATMRSTDSSGGADYHAVCVAGYEVTHEGYMNVQVIDSGCGAGLLTIESLTRELNSGHATPIMAITRAAKTV